MRYRLTFGIVAVLVVSLLVSACSIVEPYQQADDFTKKTDDFVLRMEWQDFIGASLHFKEDIREDFLERFDDWDTLKVTEVKLSRATSVLYGKIERKIVHYKFEYYLLSDMVVRKENVELIWELAPDADEKTTYWRIVDAFPELEVEKK